MVISVLKHNFHRSTPKELVYRDYKNFDRVIFKSELEDKLNQWIWAFWANIFWNAEYSCTNKEER